MEHHSPRVQCTASIKESGYLGKPCMHHCKSWSHTGKSSHECDCGFTWSEVREPATV